MSIISRFKESQIGQFWLKHEKKIILAIGIILIAAVSFEAGFLKGQESKSEPIVVNKSATAEIASVNTGQNQTSANDTKTAPANSKSALTEDAMTLNTQKCSFVASKNSNKYHLPSCRYAQNIKPENRVCFSSKEEAESRGYQGAKCCIK